MPAAEAHALEQQAGVARLCEISTMLTGALGYINAEKQTKTLGQLDAAIAGNATVEEYEKLTGLLNHLVCLLGMPYTVMYGIYDVHDRARELKLQSQEPAPIGERASTSLHQWRQAVVDTARAAAEERAAVGRGGLHRLGWALFPRLLFPSLYIRRISLSCALRL